jgi:phage terminase large subunit
MKLRFNTYGNEKQKLVCTYWNDPEVSDIVYGGSKGSGKSYLGCSLIFGDAFTYDGTYYFIARRKLNDIRKFTIPSIYEVFRHWGLDGGYYSYNGQDSYFQLANKSRVYLLDAAHLPSDPLFQRFGSMQMTRGWIEEAGEFEESAKNNLAASIGRWKNGDYGIVGKLLQTCNPSKNYLYREYYRKHKDGGLEKWRRFVQALPEDNKKLPEGYLENLHRTLSPNEKERLLYGNWEYDDDPAALIQYEKILDCFSNSFLTGMGDTFITADIARFGSDTTVVGVWTGFCVHLYQYSHLSVSEVAAKIKQFQNKYQVPNSRTIADEDGVGGGVVDILGCCGFVNNSSPLANPLTKEPENYNNLKSQCYFRLAERINKAGLYIECDDVDIKSQIIQELEQVKQHNMDKDGKRQVLPKDKVKDLIGRSPDFSDTLMMREWFELSPKIEFWAA